MPYLPKEYRALLELDERLPSWMVAQLPEDEEAPGVTDLLASLEGSPLELVDTEVIGTPTIPDARWEVRVRVREGEVERDHTIWMQPTEKLEQGHFEWTRLTAGDHAASQSSAYSLGVSSSFGATPLADYQHQIKVLAIIAPRAVACLDIAACWPRPGGWMHEVAWSSAPPSPENLFCVHAVYEDEDATEVWLHTHGLLRCGSFELEMMEVPREHASLMGQLLNATAALFIEHGPTEADDPFDVGAGLALTWLPWQKGIGQFARKAQGSTQDRDRHHSYPSAVLFAPGRKLLGLFGSRFKNPACHLPILMDNPVLYVSNMETERMALLARERLQDFLALQDDHGSKDDWLFLVKLGYPVDGAESEADREHLWFEVHTAGGGKVDATLLNAPYNVSGLQEGERAEHGLEPMSCWTIICPHGRFDPDTVMHLKRALADGDGEREG